MSEHKLVDGKVIPLTSDELAQRAIDEANWNAGAFNRAIATLRAKRNALLSATDFYALSDNTLTTAMSDYRQELRDITNNISNVEQVNEVVFPVKP
jgi:hypothetical protein